jgi:hypothetical protein
VNDGLVNGNRNSDLPLEGEEWWNKKKF